MLLYHGSPFRFNEPDPQKGKKWRDFGVGFYLAEQENDSLSISVKRGGDGWLYTYEVDENAAFSLPNVMEFDGFSVDWARFVFDNRMYGEDLGYDLVIGQTAGGHASDLFERFRRDGERFDVIEQEMLREVQNTTFGVQWCFSTPGAIDLLELVSIEKIERG